MKPIYILLTLSLILSIISNGVYGQKDTTPVKGSELKNSVSTDPLLPLFNSFAIIYEYGKKPRSSLILGLWYGKTTETYPKLLKYPGYAVNISPIFAYRQYLWKKLHLEYQLYPGFTKYYENIEDKYYRSFNLFNEFRVGYKFVFQISKLPILLNLQIPVGFTIFDSNEPATFKTVRKQDPIFYIFYPNIYLGIRW